MSKSELEKGLEKLQNKLLNLGALVHDTVVESIQVLKNRDIDAARHLIAADADLNRRRFAIESDTLVLMVRQQPMATDLRTLAAVLNIATELERIADYSKSNARNTIKLGTRPPTMPLMDIPQMAELASEMLQSSLISFTGRNVQMAGKTASRDPEVDLLYDQVYMGLMDCVITNPSNIETASNLMWIAHNLERTADRAVNICERVIFTVTGVVIEFDDSAQDLSECDVQAAFPSALNAR
jgi:phosphate transport system protein